MKIKWVKNCQQKGGPTGMYSQCKNIAVMQKNSNSSLFPDTFECMGKSNVPTSQELWEERSVIPFFSFLTDIQQITKFWLNKILAFFNIIPLLLLLNMGLLKGIRTYIYLHTIYLLHELDLVLCHYSFSPMSSQSTSLDLLYSNPGW